MTDTNKLREKIQSAGLKYTYVAKCLGLSPYGLQRKIDNKSEFRASEISRLSELLNLSGVEMQSIFFAT